MSQCIYFNYFLFDLHVPYFLLCVITVSALLQYGCTMQYVRSLDAKGGGGEQLILFICNSLYQYTRVRSGNNNDMVFHFFILVESFLTNERTFHHSLQGFSVFS